MRRAGTRQAAASPSGARRSRHICCAAASRSALDLPDGRIRVIAPDVGGGFGQKIPLHPEEVAVALAARRLGRPVVWIEDRRENLIGATQAKEQWIDLQLALAADGEFLGAPCAGRRRRGRLLPQRASALIEPYLSAYLMPGVYRIRHLELEIAAVLTNKAPTAPYRGVGWTAGHTARELLVDRAAAELGTRPRRAAAPQHGALPTSSPTSPASGCSTTRAATRSRSTGRSSWSATRRSAGASSRPAARVGISASGSAPTSSRPAGGRRGAASRAGCFASHDAARVTIEPSGEITVAIGTPSQGQGHATAIAQLVADRLGATPEDVTVIANDTAATPISSTSGTRASRVAVVIGGAVLRAAEELRERLLADRRVPARGRPGRSRARGRRGRPPGRPDAECVAP